MGVRCDDASDGRPFPLPAAEPVDVRAFAFVPAMARGYWRASSTVEPEEEGTARGGRLDERATRRSWSAGTRAASVGTGGATMAGRRSVEARDGKRRDGARVSGGEALRQTAGAQWDGRGA